jgi:nitrogen regulation protein NR(I)
MDDVRRLDSRSAGGRDVSRILVVDDEPNVLRAFEEILRGQGYEAVTDARAEEAFARLETEAVDLAILDICMPGINGLEALQRIKRRHPHLPVIIVTGQGTMETAVEATKRGAFDYHLKPFDPEELLQSIAKALEGARLMRGRIEMGAERPAGEAIVGQGRAMQEIYKAIGRVAPTDATVLIRGESGTGKELIARAIYQHSPRNNKPLVAVNCAAIPETLLESELFGYEAGAFTGAARRRIGKLEQAHEGTVFLDEIGDVPLGIQVKILRVLQERQFERLGGSETIGVDVRLIAATNRDLERAMAQGTFREDLYHRLNVVTIRVPPLRQRREDIPTLVDYVLEREARELGVPKPPVSDEALRMLGDHPWPGNVRQLEHCLQRVLIFTRGYPIQAADLAPMLGEAALAGKERLEPSVETQLDALVRRYLSAQSGPGCHEHLMARLEKSRLAEALRRCRGNQTHAARFLGLTRPTLHAKMQKHGLSAEPSDW